MLGLILVSIRKYKRFMLGGDITRERWLTKEVVDVVRFAVFGSLI
jgi:hypothetical protein